MIQIGSKIPNQIVKQLTTLGVEDIALDEICQNKKIILFGLPGAFTPVCTGRQVPGYIEQSDKIKQKGIDGIYCLAVNDPFVLEAWGKHLNINGKITLLSDWDAKAVKSMGLSVELPGPGLGIRSNRFAMIINNGIIENLFVEEALGNCTISGGDQILETL